MKKFFLTALLGIFTLMSAQAFHRFDLNRDGGVDVGDINLILAYILNPVDDEDEIGRGLYVCNEAGWADVALYAWPQGDVLPDWPGVPASGTVEKYGKTYSKFDLGDGFFGTELNFIANNNLAEGASQVDLMTTTLGDEPVFVTIYINKAGALAYRIDDGTDPGEEPEPELGYTLYVHSDLGWDTYYMYVWSNTAGGNVEAGWPGVKAAETTTINGEQWHVFKMSKTYSNYTDTNWIINNGTGGEGNQFDLMSDYSFQANAYVRVAADGSYTISNSAN